MGGANEAGHGFELLGDGRRQVVEGERLAKQGDVRAQRLGELSALHGGGHEDHPLARGPAGADDALPGVGPEVQVGQHQVGGVLVQQAQALVDRRGLDRLVPGEHQLEGEQGAHVVVIVRHQHDLPHESNPRPGTRASPGAAGQGHLSARAARTIEGERCALGN